MRAFAVLLLLIACLSASPALAQSPGCNISPIPIFPTDLFDTCAWINFLIFVLILFILLPLVVGILSWLALGVFYTIKFCFKPKQRHFYTAEEKRTCRVSQATLSVLLILIAIIGIIASLSYSASVQVAMVSIFNGGREIIAETNKTGASVRALANTMVSFLDSYLILKESVDDIHKTGTDMNTLVQDYFIQGFQNQYLLLNDTQGQLYTLSSSLQNFTELSNSATITIDKRYLPSSKQVPSFDSLLTEFATQNNSLNLRANSAFAYIKSGYEMFEANSGKFIAPFEKVKQAQDFAGQFYSFENVTSWFMDQPGILLDAGLRTVESVRLVLFCLGFGIIICVFPWFCTCFCADNDTFESEHRYASCYRNVLCCHASCSCFLILSLVLFGAFNLALFTIIMPGCVGTKKPQFYLLQGNRSAAAFTRNLLSCEGNATIFDIAEKTAGLDISALKDTKQIDDFFAKLNNSVSFLNMSSTMRVLNDAHSFFAQVNTSLRQVLYVEAVTLVPLMQQWRHNLTQIQNTMVDPTGQGQAVLINMITNTQQIIDVLEAQVLYLQRLVNNQTASIVNDLEYFERESVVLPPLINNQIIPQAYAIISWVRRALQSAQCQSVSETFDKTYWNVCYWGNASMVMIGVSSLVLAILLFIMFPVACLARKRYEIVDETSLYDTHMLLDNSTDTYGT